MASDERNALAELAHTLCGVVVDNRHYATVGEYLNAEDALKKSIRIIAELAKVDEWIDAHRDEDGVAIIIGLKHELAERYSRCRAIAEEGAKE